MENGNRKKLYLVTLSVSMAMVTLGVSSVLFSYVQYKFTINKTHSDINMKYKVIAVRSVGIAVGSLATGYISDRFGRRITVLGSALPFAIGSVVAMFPQKAWLLYIVSLTWDCATAMVRTVSNYYISEVADKDVRGRLSVITGIMPQFGALLINSVCPFISYKGLNFIMLVLSFLFFGTCWWIPETPYYCLKSGNLGAARRSLRTLRGYKDENVLEDELLALKVNVTNEMRRPTTVKEFFVGAQYRIAILIAVGLKVTQIIAGVSVLRFFFSFIMDEIRFKVENLSIVLVLTIYSVIIFIAGIMSSVLVDRVGRRPLLVFSYIGTGVSLAAVSLCFFLQEVIKINLLATIGFIPLLGIIFASIISSVGFNSVIFIIPAEIFPMNVKAIAMTSLSLLEIAVPLVSKAYVLLEMHCGFTVLFSILTGVALAGSIFSYFLVIETKGKDLGDIQVELQGEVYHTVDVNNKLERIVANDENEQCIEIKELTRNDISDG